MPATIESVLSLAMTLSDEERVVVAERLMDSVPVPEEELDDATKATLDRRWEEIVSGKVKCIPHEEVMARLQSKYGV